MPDTVLDAGGEWRGLWQIAKRKKTSYFPSKKLVILSFKL